MTNVEKLQEIGGLGDIRRRLGAETEEDTSVDNAINNMTNHDLIKEWCAWRIGTGHWWEVMKRMFDKLESLK